MKKVMSILLAVALVFQLGIPALAAESHTITLTTNATTAEVGDYVYVTVNGGQDRSSKGMSVGVYFDTTELEFDKSLSTVGASNSVFKVTKVKTDDTEYGTYVDVLFADFNNPVSLVAGAYYTLAFKTLKAGQVSVHTYNARAELYDAGVDEDGDDAKMNALTPVAENTLTFTVTEKPAHTHTYGVPTWTWGTDNSTATATFTCTNNDDTQTVDATVTSDTSDSTKTVYTATVSFNGDTYTDTKTVTTAAANGYTITAEEDKTLALSGTVQIPIKISSTKETTFNSYDLTVTYDTDKLTYDSYTAADAEENISVADNNGTIRIIGYGEDKNVDTAAVTLSFTAKAVGTANVVISSAKVDSKVNATMKDAPAASVVKDTTAVKVEMVHVTKDKLVGANFAKAGADYTFSKAFTYYDYTDLKVMVGEKDVTEQVKVNDDGSWTIPGSVIDNHIVITVTTTPKSYDVTVEGTGKADVTAAAKATYNTDYTFSISKVGGFTYEVSVTVNGVKYTLTDGYTIKGVDITGDIVITVNKTETSSGDNTVSVTKPDYVTGGANATKGQNYTFSITEEEGYSYGKPTVKVGSTDITEKVTYDEETKTYTIPGAEITDAITIAVTRTDKFTLSVSQYLTLDEKVMYLITASDVKEGKCAKYDGLDMYFSDKYNAYAWLVISSEGLETVKATAEEKVAIAVASGTATKVNYTGDVNGSSIIDVNDAQLTYDMYTAKYGSFEKVEILKFLNADVNGDKTVNSTDAAAIVDAIKKQ